MDPSVKVPREVTVLNSKALTHLFSKLRDEKSTTATFVYYANRLMRILAEEGIAHLPSVEKEIQTPCGMFKGVEINEDNCIVVSIIRAGDSLLDAVRFCLPSVQVGKILIQRDESTKEKTPVLYYTKFPKNISSKSIILVDPMLATGGSAISAITCLIKAGVLEAHIIFLNVISSPEGIKNLTTKFPLLKIVTASIDEKLDENKYIVPGLGDWGDRFYGTC